jgi:hypothetical protein
MSDANAAVDIYLEAAECNREDPLLQGALLVFPNYGQLVMTGDLHGNHKNFNKLVKYCDLDRAAVRHVILHELIHEEPATLDDVDMSHLLSLEAAKLKVAYADQVHFLQSNHELAQLTGHTITKAGRSVTQAFDEGVAQTYGDADAPKVLDALKTFIRSFPLAGRTPNRIMLSHSLPGKKQMKDFDPTVVHRVPTDEDLADKGSAFAMAWGRNQSPDLLDELAKAFDVDCFVVGHQPQEMGYKAHHHRMLIIASDHGHGMFLPFDLKKSYDRDDLIDLLRPFAAFE